MKGKGWKINFTGARFSILGCFQCRISQQLTIAANNGKHHLNVGSFFSNIRKFQLDKSIINRENAIFIIPPFRVFFDDGFLDNDCFITKRENTIEIFVI